MVRLPADPNLAVLGHYDLRFVAAAFPAERRNLATEQAFFPGHARLLTRAASRHADTGFVRAAVARVLQANGHFHRRRRTGLAADLATIGLATMVVSHRRRPSGAGGEHQADRQEGQGGEAARNEAFHQSLSG